MIVPPDPKPELVIKCRHAINPIGGNIEENRNFLNDLIGQATLLTLDFLKKRDKVLGLSDGVFLKNMIHKLNNHSLTKVSKKV
jgi:hypothetical protein